MTFGDALLAASAFVAVLVVVESVRALQGREAITTFRGLYETIHAALFLALIAACYLFVLAGSVALLWVVFAALVRAAL